MGTGALETVNQIVTYAIVLARIGVTIIDVELAVFPLEAFGTHALIGTNEIIASCSVLARVAGTLIGFVLAIASVVSLVANTLMTVSNISAVSSILAEFINVIETSEKCRRLARHLSHIADFSRPTRLAFTQVRGSSLDASSSVFTWGFAAPVHKLFAMISSPSGLTMARIVPVVIVDARSSILARIFVAMRPWNLAVGPGVAVGTDTRVVVDTVDASPSIQAR